VGQRPRVLQPEQSALHLFGARLRLLREQRGLSQRALGQLAYCSGHLIGKIEKGERRPSADLARRCDDLLGGAGTLVGLLPATEPGGSDSAAGSEVLGHLPALRQALDAHDLPDDGPVRPVSDLQHEVARLVQWRLDSRYADLASYLPVLLPELHRAMQSPGSQAAVAALLAQAYRAADAIADKFGLFDLSARIIDLMRTAAAAADDELLVAASSYVRAETFFATGSWATGRRMLERSAASLRRPYDSVPATAAYGSLHMRAAVLAARGGDDARANDHLREASNAAQLVPEGTYRGTAFGPASVRIHRLSLAVDLGDVATALQAAEEWVPPQNVRAERRSHFFVELARAHVLANQPERALGSLWAAREIGPQHIRHNPDVKTALARMLCTVPRPSHDLLSFARWTGSLSAVTSSDEEDQEARSASR
jgi:transcriptional regulator with XRE-family HTH domain